jgi:DNA uptake protein ComE-like DNA-binding protein
MELAAYRIRVENGAVQTKARFIVSAIVVFAIFLAGSSQALPKTVSGIVAIPAAEARVDVNRATLDELLKVPGMTRSWAGRIVRFRPYHRKLDLLDQGVVSNQVYDRIKNYVIAHRDKP